MALKDLTDEELQAVIEEVFAESGISEWLDVEEISMAAVRMAVNKSYALISKMNMESRAVIGETLATGIMEKITPDDLKKRLLDLNEAGEIQLRALRTSDGKTISIETRAATIARTELFGIYEDTKFNAANELLDVPIGIAHTAEDGRVRKEHAAWNDKAMLLSDWGKAKDRPGMAINCRCNLEVMELTDYKGQIYNSLSEMGY